MSSLSFYDWYCDLPNASPETWGEQTDVQESADWFNAKLLAVMGSNLNMTRTPDCHFAAEARHNGSKMWVFAPDFNQVAKYADEWVSINAGQDGAWWMAVNHVLLKESSTTNARRSPFPRLHKRYTDSPFSGRVDAENGHYRAGQHAARQPPVELPRDVENGDWKFLMWDASPASPRCRWAARAFRWGEEGQVEPQARGRPHRRRDRSRAEFPDDYDDVHASTVRRLRPRREPCCAACRSLRRNR